MPDYLIAEGTNAECLLAEVEDIEQACTDSVVSYICPYCQAEHELEPDAGIIRCNCGHNLLCDIIEIMEAM